MINNTIKGNVSGGTASPSDLTATQTTAMLNPVIGDSGSGGIKGLVPAPAVGDAAALKYLSADGTFKPTALAATVVFASASTTTLSTVDSVLNSMTITPVAGTYMVLVSGVFSSSSSNSIILLSVYGAATQIAASIRSCVPRVSAAALTLTMGTHAQVTVNGSQAITAQWHITGGGTATCTNRSMDIFRIG